MVQLQLRLMQEQIMLEIKKDRLLILKNNAPFVSCITKINNELIEDADNLDIVMPMYKFIRVQ